MHAHLTPVAGAAAVSAAAVPSMLLPRQSEYAALLPAQCVDACGAFLNYADLCDDPATLGNSAACLEMCKPAEWATLVPCYQCMFEARNSLELMEYVREPPEACTDLEAFGAAFANAADSGASPSSGAGAAPSAAAEVSPVAEVTPVADVTPVAEGVAAAVSVSASSSFKPTSPTPPALPPSSSASASASVSATPSSGAHKTAVTLVALGAALLFASAF
ncbi:unnamed protein product [Cutaneotrichosporon oleaginosum]